ncbi:relaxase/mobilization nuclease [Streptomyces sp. NPDC005271]|uniref:relaxase/mobilization nuclease n=1 Tax=unclassified Streptomyces TaxID=2593676 RepID=UPI0033BBD592
MIPRTNLRAHGPYEPLGEALGRPVPTGGGIPEVTVVAYWPGLGSYTLDDEQAPWTATQWAEHLEDPLLEEPFVTSPHGDRRAIFHLDVRLHPDDRELSGPEWAEAAHRLARAAGIEVPGEANGCRWIAVQAQPGRLDLIANLIRLDGSWHTPPAEVLRCLSDEARRIEKDLRLIPVRSTSRPQTIARPAPTASAQLAVIISQLADERTGPLATVRGLIEHTAHQAARQPGAAGADTAHRLELIARRLYGIQQDLDTAATHLNAPTRPRTGFPAPPAITAPSRRSP